MGIDLGASDLVSTFDGSCMSWPKCLPCSIRMRRPYPVESLSVDGADDPRLLGVSYTLCIGVECHGEMMRVGVDIPARFFPSNKYQALSYIWCFVPGARGHVAEFRPDSSTGALLTDAR